MKSLLDSSPELWNRAEEYVVIKRHEALVKCSNPNEPDIERLLRQILMDCKREHLK
ncbi:MAG TPA: hypothetical protein VMT26_01410 [Candidatus Bathyarchaeia archaeon]|nr:hypothetical protein [Candidatus Bathyarchaeia archaeon]